MKRVALGVVLVLAAPVAAQAPAVAPLEGSATFISPMGEPVRSTDALSGAEHWFQAADTDHDGRLTREEMRADADRFFKTLDTDHDGELGPDEISHYEVEVAPEIRVASTMGDMSQAKTDNDGKFIAPPYPTRLGAGRYGYLDMPEPVVACDANMDRAVSRQEFESAALRRFKVLDADGDGAITRAELPKLSAKLADDKRNRSGRKREGGRDRSRGPGEWSQQPQ